jgi:UDP-GlcNAc:undecaprenyl-phosphate GlcNAc-1-phosphate transferase
LPLLLLGLPIADINVVLYRRIRGGMSWFKATRNHVHHRLLDLGFTHYQSVVLIYSFQACLVACAVLLRYASDLVVLLLYFGAVGALFALLTLAERKGWKRGREALASRPVGSGMAPVHAERDARLQSACVWIIAAMVCFLMLFAVFRSDRVPLDFGITAGVLLLVSLAVIAWHRDWQGFTLRVLAYGTTAVATYLLLSYPAAQNVSQQGFGVVIVVLAAMLAIFVRFLSRGRFGTTPTDYLIGYALLVLLAVAAIGGRGFSAGSPLQLVTFLVVLFYGCEVVIGHLQRWRSVLGSASFAALLVVAVRGLTAAF